MIEIELKIPITKSQIPAIHEAVSSKDVRVLERRIEKISMYDNKEKTMQNQNSRLRVRTTGDNTELSCKQPLPGDIKREIEYEVTVSDYPSLKNILEKIGYHPVSSYERYRTTFFLEKTKITIDEYPFQTYIEIEGEKKEIKNAAEMLKLDLAQNTNKPCDTLFSEWRKSKGLPPQAHMRFEDFDK